MPVDTSSREREFRARIANGSQNPHDYVGLSQLCHAAGRFEESERILREAVALPLPEASRALLLSTLGWCVLDARAGTGEPLSLAEESLALTQGGEGTDALIARADANSLLAHCLWETDRERGQDCAALAASLYAQLLSGQPPPEKHVLHDLRSSAACLEALLGHTDDAIRLFEAAIETADEFERLACTPWLAFEYHQAGRLPKAREELAGILKSDDAPPWLLLKACYALGSLEDEMGKLPEARAKFRRALAIMENYPAFRQRERMFLDCLSYVAGISQDLGDFEEAAKVNGTVVDLLPEDEPPHWYCLMRSVMCHFELGQYEIALSEAERVARSSVITEHDREWAHAWIPSIRWGLAKLRYEAKNYSACIAECERLLSAWGPGQEGRPSVLLLLGHSHLFRKEKLAAKRCYEETLACENATPAQRACATKYLAISG